MVSSGRVLPRALSTSAVSPPSRGISPAPTSTPLYVIYTSLCKRTNLSTLLLAPYLWGAYYTSTTVVLLIRILGHGQYVSYMPDYSLSLAVTSTALCATLPGYHLSMVHPTIIGS